MTAARLIVTAHDDPNYSVHAYMKAKNEALSIIGTIGLARALLSSPRVERERALRDAIFAVDKALENGSPRETWTSAEIAMDEDREAAIEAIRTLSTG